LDDLKKLIAVKDISKLTKDEQEAMKTVAEDNKQVLDVIKNLLSTAKKGSPALEIETEVDRFGRDVNVEAPDLSKVWTEYVDKGSW